MSVSSVFVLIMSSLAGPLGASQVSSSARSIMGEECQKKSVAELVEGYIKEGFRKSDKKELDEKFSLDKVAYEKLLQDKRNPRYLCKTVGVTLDRQFRHNWEFLIVKPEEVDGEICFLFRES